MTVLRKAVDFDAKRERLLKAVGPSSPEGVSNQSESAGLQWHPFDMCEVAAYKFDSIYHQTCVNTKIAATVGLGHTDKKTDEKLNPLCAVSWQDTIESVCDDYFQMGNGWLEVRRKDDKEITGLHHAKAPHVYIVLEDEFGENFHYEMCAASGAYHKFARFGDLAGFRERHPNQERVSELIHLRRSNSYSRWYGFPDWLACFPTIDIAKAMRQHQMSFFKNRGVPEFISWSKGIIDDDCLDAIKEAQQDHVGAENAHKNMHIHFQDNDAEFHVEKLNVEAKTESMFLMLNEATSRDIVSAHRVPPILAGILVPKQLGAANEVINALLSFQILVCGPEQKRLKTMLGCTLGDARFSNLGLSEKSFEWDKITKEFNLDDMDTVARMRQPLPQAQAQGRDIKEGLRD